MSLRMDLVNSIQPAQYRIPSGTVSPFAGPNPPRRWLTCNGQTVARALYPDLFAVLGTTYGAGDGSTTFGLPDMRGQFARGFDAGRGLDSGRGLGTSQSDALQQIYGEFNMTNGYSDCINASSSSSGVIRKAGTFQSNAAQTSDVTNTASDTIFDASAVVSTAGETRPRNIAVNFIIKV